jgi:hypothetical protein
MLAAALLLYTGFLASRFAPAISNPDANGYWAQGSLWATTGKTWFRPETDPQYLGMHWLVTPDGRYVSRYPPGLAVPIALAYRLSGPAAAVMLSPVLAVLALVGVHCLCRQLVSPAWSLVPVLVLMVNPVFGRHALSCDSHMAVLFCLSWGLVFLLAWAANRRHWQAFVAGLFLGAIPTIRYPEALFAVGIVVFLAWQWGRFPRVWSHYLAAAAGALIPIVPLLVRNHLLFGAFWRTAYALTNEQTGFAWAYFRQHAIGYLRQIQGEGVGQFFALGVVGTTLMCAHRRWRPVGWLLALLVLPITGLYMAYYWAPQSQAQATMRFVLPTFVCYVVAGTWALAQWTVSLGGAQASVVVAVVLVLQVLWGGAALVSETRLLQHSPQALALVTRAVEAQAKHGSIVMAHPQILQHLDFVRHWRLVDPTLLRDRPAAIRFLRSRKDPDAPMPMQEQKQALQAEKYQGLRPFQREREIAHDVYGWANGKGVYFVGTPRELEEMRGFYLAKSNFRELARVAIPPPPPLPRPEGFLGAAAPLGPGPGDRSEPPPAAAGGAAAGPAPWAGGGGAGMPPPGPGREPGGGLAPWLRRPGGPGSRGPGRPGGGLWNYFQDVTEIVVAEWTWRPAAPGGAAAAVGQDAGNADTGPSPGAERQAWRTPPGVLPPPR